ncbi:DUF1330 domain-containing protein [Jannaschia faecimaris]|nr:DUF1330 domain-containing protein [Jannaschia faecimaris]
MISTITVTDPLKFQDYMRRTQEVARPFGAEMMYRGKHSATLAGGPSHGEMVVVVSFPDLETLKRWNASPEYQELVALRDSSSVQTMTAYGPMD